MAKDQAIDEIHKNQQFDAKLETNNDDEDDYTMYIGVDPENLFKTLDIGKLFGFGTYIDTNPIKDIEEENLTTNRLVDMQANEDEEKECQLCSYRSYKRTNFNRHMARVHEKEFNCEQCPFACGSSDYLKEHLKAVHDGEKLKCKQCPSEFTWRTDLLRHVKGIHIGIVYTCLVCT